MIRRGGTAGEVGGSQRPDELHDCLAIGGRHVAEVFLGLFGFAAVPEDGFLDRARAAIVQVSFTTGGSRGQTDIPKGSRAPLGPGRFTFRHAVGQSRSHVMEEKVGVRMVWLRSSPFGW